MREELNPELWQLLPQWRAALDGAPVALVPDSQLHCTLETISDSPASEITKPERAALRDAIGNALNGFTPYEGRAGSAIVVRSGPLLDISPAEPLWEWHRALRRAVQSVRGPDSTAFPVSKPHVSLAYATAVENSDPWQKALRQIDPNNAPLRIEEVLLVELGVDQAAGHLHWTTVERFHLCGPGRHP